MAFGRYNFSVVDDNGNLVNGASVEVRHETVGAPLAILFSDRDGTTPLANPYTASDGANAGFFVGGGAYRITVTSGALSRDWRYVAVGTAQETDNSAIRPGAIYQWDTGTTDADPGDGNIRANNSSLASATFLYADDVSHGNSNLEAFLLSFDDSTNTIKGDLILVDLSLDTSATFKITSVTDAAGYVKIGVSNHSGETSFTAGAEIGLQFFRAGDAGAAPADAEYVVSSLHGSLSAERALTNTATVTWDFATGSQAKANVVASSDTVAGGIETATTAEMETGTSTTVAVTPGRQHRHPYHCKAWVAFSMAAAIDVQSGNIVTIADNGTGTFGVVKNTFSGNGSGSVSIELTSSAGQQAHFTSINGTTANVVCTNNTGTASETSIGKLHVMLVGDE